MTRANLPVVVGIPSLRKAALCSVKASRGPRAANSFSINPFQLSMFINSSIFIEYSSLARSRSVLSHLVLGQAKMRWQRAQWAHCAVRQPLGVGACPLFFNPQLPLAMIPSILLTGAPVAFSLFLPFTFTSITSPRATTCNGFSDVGAHSPWNSLQSHLIFCLVLREKLWKYYFCRRSWLVCCRGRQLWVIRATYVSIIAQADIPQCSPTRTTMVGPGIILSWQFKIKCQPSLVTQQLDDGIRMLQMQTHNLGGTIQLCHTSCVSPTNTYL